MSSIRIKLFISVTRKVISLHTSGCLSHNALVTADAIFSGITTFAKLPWVQCLTKDKDERFDIAFIGAPFARALSSDAFL
jgi:hypothetical protein